MSEIDAEKLRRAIEDAGDIGATTDELKQMFPQYVQQKRLGPLLAGLQRQERICKVDDVWVADIFLGSAEVEIDRPEENDTRADDYPAKALQERAYQKGWSGSRVTVVRDPDIFPRAIRLQLVDRETGRYLEIPLLTQIKIQITNLEPDELDIQPLMSWTSNQWLVSIMESKKFWLTGARMVR